MQKKDADLAVYMNSGADIFTLFLDIYSIKVVLIKEIKIEQYKNSTY